MDILILFFGFIIGYLLLPLLKEDIKLNQLFKNLRQDLLKRLGVGLLFGLAFLLLQSKISNPYVLLAFLSLSSSLLYLGLYDLKHFEIPAYLVYFLVPTLFVINVVIFFTSESITIWEGNEYIASDNIIAFLVSIIVIGSIVVGSKEKAMGKGDIFLAAIVGLMLGWQKLIIAFYIIILSGSFVGILYGIKQGKLKGVQIPFVPFIVWGTLITFIFWDSIYQLINNYFLFTQY